MHGDERDREPGLGAEFDDDGCHECRDQDVVRGRWNAEAEDERDRGDQQQHGDDVATRDELDELRHHEAEARERHGADDDARSRRGNGDADHVARTAGETIDQIGPAFGDCGRDRLLPEYGQQQLARCDDAHDGDRAPEGGESR